MKSVCIVLLKLCVASMLNVNNYNGETMVVTINEEATDVGFKNLLKILNPT